jgi:hypothetical protein
MQTRFELYLHAPSSRLIFILLSPYSCMFLWGNLGGRDRNLMEEWLVHWLVNITMRSTYFYDLIHCYIW